MKRQGSFRLACCALLWLFLCYLMITGRGFNAWTLFVIIVSGALVFVPVYKKYFRDNDGKN